MVHYIPASLENITEVVAYVVDEKNEEQMKEVVRSANSWCKRALSEEGLAKGSILQLGAYKEALDSHDGGSLTREWKKMKQRYTSTLDDLVDCDAWSVVDWFTSPMFAGL